MNLIYVTEKMSQFSLESGYTIMTELIFTVYIFYSRFIYCSIVIKSKVVYNILFEEFTFCNCIQMLCTYCATESKR